MWSLIFFALKSTIKHLFQWEALEKQNEKGRIMIKTIEIAGKVVHIDLD